MKQGMDSLKAQKAEMEQQKGDIETSRNEAQKRVRIAKHSDGPR
jgi:hypothetical protein